MNIEAMHTRLVSELTQLDARESQQEAKRRHRVNIYRIAHYLGAAQATLEDGGDTLESFAKAFADNFVATRGMHGIAKRLGLPLDVERGDWVRK